MLLLWRKNDNAFCIHGLLAAKAGCSEERQIFLINETGATVLRYCSTYSPIRSLILHSAHVSEGNIYKLEVRWSSSGRRQRYLFGIGNKLRKYGMKYIGLGFIGERYARIACKLRMLGLVMRWGLTVFLAFLKVCCHAVGHTKPVLRSIEP